MTQGRSCSAGGAPRYARAFVVVFLAALVLCPVAADNAWPFSAWQLFSRIRSDQQTSWQAVAVDRSGQERVASLTQGYRGFIFIVADFSARSSAERDAICAAWLRSARHQFGDDARLLRIYRLRWRVTDRRGDRAAPPGRTLTWICTTRGVREAT